jgi:hypothetical protein
MVVMNRWIFLALLMWSMTANAQQLFPPTNLGSEVNDQDVVLTWNEPDTVLTETLTYSSGINVSSVGLGGAGSFAVAARFTPNQLSLYDGMAISKVTLFIADNTDEVNLKIWKGPNADSLAYIQNIDDVSINSFDEIVLDAPYQIDASDELWIGYEVTGSDSFFPAGFDEGPAVASFGDMLYYDGEWFSGSDIGFDGNWNIIAHVAVNNKLPVYSGEPVKEDMKSIATTAKLEQISTVTYYLEDFPKRTQENLLGYNVYRDEVRLNDNPLASLSYTDSGLTDGLYTYEVTAEYVDGESAPVSTSAYIGHLALLVEPSEIIDTVHINESSQYVLTITNTQDISVAWSANVNHEFMFASPQSGNLDAGESIDIAVFVFNYNINEAATIEDEIEFVEINQGFPLATVPFSITFKGGPLLSVWPHELNFGDVYIGNQTSHYISISNSGTDTLIVDDINTSSSMLNVDVELPIVLAPHDFIYTYATYTGEELGEVSEEIIFSTNDESNPTFTIPVYANVGLEPPVYLFAEVQDSANVQLEWDMAINFNEDWFGWGGNQNYSSVGLGSDGIYYVAQKFSPEDLTDLNGKSLSSVAFFPYGSLSTYTVHIWQGDGNTDPWVSQEVENYQPYVWNEVELETPITISDDQELWIAIEIYNAEWEYPIGVDMGPAVDGKGDLLNIGDGWQSFGWGYNWNIKAYATDSQTGIKAPLSENRVKLDKYYSKNKLTEVPVKPQLNQRSSADFLGFNVYRDGVQLNSEMLTVNEFTDLDVADGIFEYGVTAIYDLGESEQTKTTIQTAAPGIVFNPEVIVGNVDAGENTTFDFTISNDGDIDLEFTYSNYYSYYFTVSPASGVVPPGETLNMQLTVDGTYLYPGPFESVLGFEINNLNAPYAQLPIELMVGSAGNIEVSIDSLDFGQTLAGNTVVRYVELTNPGNGYAYIDNVSIGTPEFAAYAYSLYLYPNETLQLPVYFMPGSVGTYEDQLEISLYGDSTIVIDLFGAGVLAPPMALSAAVDSTSVRLDWISPNGIPDNALQYVSNEISTSLGFSDGGTFSVAAKFTQQELMTFSNKYLTEVGFIVASDDADITVKVWTGNDGENLIYQQDVSDFNTYEWNDVSLDMPIPLVDIETLYIGYEVTHPSFSYPATVDGGPAVTGKGDLIWIDEMGWVSLSEMYGLQYNFMVRGLTSMDSTIVNSRNVEDVLLGYNVYRNGDKLNVDQVITESEYTDSDLTPGTYSYEVTAVYDIGESPAAGPIVVDFNVEQALPPGWGYTATEMTHMIMIPGTESRMASAAQMEEGDLIGLFFPHNGEEVSAGVVRWENKDVLHLTAYGDNPETSIKEGFTMGEQMHWRVYKQSTGEVMKANVTFSHDMPHYDGEFQMLGMSMVTNMSMTPLSTEEMSIENLNVYPMPAKDFVNISGITQNTIITVINSNGQIVKQEQTTGSGTYRIDLSGLNGMYLLRIQNGKQMMHRPLVIQ